MHTPPFDFNQLPPQNNTISLQDAQNRALVWRTVLEKLISPDGTATGGQQKADLPKCIFIGLEDLQQLADDYRKAGILVSGVRLYFTFENNNVNADYHITGMLVPTYRPLMEEVGLKHPPDYDLLLPVPLSGDSETATGVSVYDFTRPCPTYCSGTADILTGSSTSHKSL